MVIEEKVREVVSNCISDNFTVSVETASFAESNPALDLVEADWLHKSEVVTDWETVIVRTDEDELVFRISIGLMQLGNIVYISDFEVGQPYQNQGLGSSIHSEVVSVLCKKESIEFIFELPTNDAMESIVRSDGFVSCSSSFISDWFKKDCLVYSKNSK